MNKKQKSLTNKAFSLVELIIVIAIMAVLVGALAPQYVKYLDKSRISADTQIADGVRQAIQVTMLDPDVAAPTYTAGDYADLPDVVSGSTMEAFWTTVYGVLGVTDGDAVEAKLKLDKDDADMEFMIDSNKGVHVRIIGGDYGTDSSPKIQID